jgi:hypothetical protein
VKSTLLPHAWQVLAPGVNFAPHLGQDDMVSPGWFIDEQCRRSRIKRWRPRIPPSQDD